MSKILLAQALTAFIGTKTVLATPMTRAEYCSYRGWELPKDEDPAEQVYLVEYTDGGKPNDERHNGYITMSPKDVFDNAYRQNGQLTFGDALFALKQGKKIARSGWNGKGMWLVLVKPYDDAVHSGSTPCFCYRSFELPNGANGEPAKSPKSLPYIAMKTVNDELVPWLANQTDVLVNDWLILDEHEIKGDISNAAINGLSAQKTVKLEDNGTAILQGEKGESSSETLSSVGACLGSNDYAVMDKCRLLLEVIKADPAKCDFVVVKDAAVSKLSDLIGGL